MSRVIAVFAVAMSLAGCAGSPFSAAPASNVAPTSSGPNAYPQIPQSHHECVTDDGYGRWQPCGNQS
jgi:hypothetical protein